MGPGCVQVCVCCCTSLVHDYRGPDDSRRGEIRWRNAVVARNAATLYLWTPRNFPFSGPWRSLCDLICQHLCLRLSKRMQSKVCEGAGAYWSRTVLNSFGFLGSRGWGWLPTRL